MTRLVGNLVAGAGVLIAAVVLIPREAAVTAPANARKAERIALNPGPRPVPSSARASELPPPAAPPHAGAQGDPEWLDSRIDALHALAGSEDSGSLGKILAEIRSPVPEIRAAALEATREFGSRDAVPYLQTLANESRDPAQSKELADLIEFLNLPTLIEHYEGDVQE